MTIFWRNGYEGASLNDLTHVMAINRPSLYAKFGNKRGPFLAEIDYYTETISAPQSVPLATELDVRDAVSGYYRKVINCVSADGRPPGCLIASVATELAARDEEICQKVADLLRAAEDSLKRACLKVILGARVTSHRHLLRLK
jgi:AcrR family transcriptional regulator